MVLKTMRHAWHFIYTVLGVIFRHPITGTSVIPILPNGHIVLIRRRDNGLWALPGGIVNWGENIQTSVERELHEETGLEVTQIRRLVGVYSAPDRDPRIHSICIVVEADVQGEMQTCDPSEVLEVQSFPPESLPIGNLSHDHDRQLKDYFQGTTQLA